MKSTERFSDRVENYRKYRPSYPMALIDTLVERCRLNTTLNQRFVIADIGSGTGKLSELLLDRGFLVHGVEPNVEMRNAAEDLFQQKENFTSFSGDSSTTGLDDDSVDVILAAQAFHWFDKGPTKKEFQRILKSAGYIGLIWNERDTSTHFQKDYDQMLEAHCDGYAELVHRNISEQDIGDFFSPNSFEVLRFSYSQMFDEEAFIGRMYSSSYTPQQGLLESAEIEAAARALFDRYEKQGVVEFSYSTKLYLSKI